eukprot:13216322-Alexandrium_andersonii.AAC.1
MHRRGPPAPGMRSTPTRHGESVAQPTRDVTDQRAAVADQVLATRNHPLECTHAPARRHPAAGLDHNGPVGTCGAGRPNALSTKLRTLPRTSGDAG